MDIKNLTDYPLLEKLAGSLWKTNSQVRGAAIMVGAGFSRAAARCGDRRRRMPLWRDLTSALETDLQILNDEISDPLRLAEQYVAYFGRRALIDLVRDQVADSAWSPGPLHEQLLRLPWQDVLSTNWDSLLERAAERVFDPKYSAVNQQPDLAVARSPRITKLHGTIGVTSDLVFTQEDYRQYPDRYAAFVNFARQVFIENELCLIGFSGDDPNFLQWAGWVKDRLDTHARRIFLVGNLRLSDPARRYLESINIAPIDLHDLVSHIEDIDAQHILATTAFLEELAALRQESANKWRPRQLRNAPASSKQDNKEKTLANLPFQKAPISINQIAQALEDDRRSFPDWLLCPQHLIFSLMDQIGAALQEYKDDRTTDVNLRCRLLCEAVWRMAITFQEISPEIVNESLSLAANASSGTPDDGTLADLLLSTLSCLHPALSEEDRCAVAQIDAALEPLCRESARKRDERSAILAAIARDSLAEQEMEKHVNAIRGDSNALMQRKAVLMAELGRYSEAEPLIAKVRDQLVSDYSGDRRSLGLRDRLAWMDFIAGTLRRFPTTTVSFDPINVQRDDECDPWRHIEFLRKRLREEGDLQEQQSRIEPSFTPGHFVKGPDGQPISNLPPSVRILYGICNQASIPLKWNHISFLAKEAKQACLLQGVTWRERLTLAIRTADNPSYKALNGPLSRLEVACLCCDDAAWGLKIVRRSTEYWLKQVSRRAGPDQIFCLERLGCLFEAAGRLAVRATAESTAESFKSALITASDPRLRTRNLSDSLSTLVRQTWESVPPSERSQLLPDILDFPIGPEIFDDDTSANAWPELGYWVANSRPDESCLDRRISQLIEYVGRSPGYTRCALIRLHPLARGKLLTDSELNRLKKNVIKNYKVKELRGTGLLCSVFLSFFQDDNSDLKDEIRQRLYDSGPKDISANDNLKDILRATNDEKVSLVPSADQARRLFDILCSWMPRYDQNDILGFVSREDKQTAELIGRVLSIAVIPNLSDSDLSEDNLARVLELGNIHKNILVTEGLVYFALQDLSRSEVVKQMIVTELHQRDPGRSMAAAEAISIWRTSVDNQLTQNLCSRLVYVAASSQTSSLHGILSTLRTLYRASCLSNQQIGSLRETVSIVFDASDYSNQPPGQSGLDATTVSLTRRECVRLAAAMQETDFNDDPELERIVTAAGEDPLPEVRFCLQDIVP